MAESVSETLPPSQEQRPVKEPGQPYPTPDMLKMMLHLNRVSEQNIPEADVDAFRQQYVLQTGLKSRASMVMIEAIFIEHLYFVKEQMTLQEKLQSLVALEKKLNEEMKYIGEFYCRMLDRYHELKYVFYAVTVDGKQFEPFDLRETPETVRYITKEECGFCRKKQLLQECIKCRRAAYCGPECQKHDWRFHKQYCKFLAAQTNT